MKRSLKIFICYRRDDTAGHTGWLYNGLKSRLGKNVQIFRDLNTIAPGKDFHEVIDEAVKSCDVFIAVIGKKWLNFTDENGRRRLDDPKDHVRVEIATALNRNILVIPALVQGATMPHQHDLPDALTGLTRRNALELSDSRWDYDVSQLTKALGEGTRSHGQDVRSRNLWIWVASSLIILVILGGIWVTQRNWFHSDPTSSPAISPQVASVSNPIITPTLPPVSPQISSGNESSSKPESSRPTSSTNLPTDAKFGKAGSVTTREDKQTVNLKTGEHLLFKLTMAGAQPIFSFACQHRTLWSDIDFPKPSANYTRIWPKDQSEVDSDIETYKFSISFFAAVKYTLLVEHLDKDGKVLELIKSKDYQSTESSDSFQENFHVIITQ